MHLIHVNYKTVVYVSSLYSEDDLLISFIVRMIKKNVKILFKKCVKHVSYYFLFLLINMF